jgi:hypothetical protein
MTDIADEIRKAVSPPGQIDPETAFRRLRAHVRGVLIDAHRALAPQQPGSWTESDDRMLDIIASWLDDVAARSGRGR